VLIEEPVVGEPVDEVEDLDRSFDDQDSTRSEDEMPDFDTSEMEQLMQQLAPSTREILDKEFHARFVRIIRPSSKNR
jgi:hypothetical protein